MTTKLRHLLFSQPTQMIQILNIYCRSRLHCIAQMLLLLFRPSVIFSPHSHNNMFWLCAVLAVVFGFLHHSVNICAFFSQDHADSAELRPPAPL